VPYVIQPRFPSPTAITYQSLATTLNWWIGFGVASAVFDNTAARYSRARFHGVFCLHGTVIVGNTAIVHSQLYPIIPNTSGADAPIGCNRVPPMADQNVHPSDANAAAMFPINMPGVETLAMTVVSPMEHIVEWTSEPVEDLPPKFGLFVWVDSILDVAIPATWTPYDGSPYDAFLGQMAIPTVPNGHTYCKIEATDHNGAVEPRWPTDGGTVTDGGFTWQDIGTTTPNTIFMEGENEKIR
jgi:hypothetical protein